MAAGDDARARIQRLLVTGDNRLKQGVAAEKVRESYLQALDVAREAGPRGGRAPARRGQARGSRRRDRLSPLPVAPNGYSRPRCQTLTRPDPRTKEHAMRKMHKYLAEALGTFALVGLARSRSSRRACSAPAGSRSSRSRSASVSRCWSASTRSGRCRAGTSIRPSRCGCSSTGRLSMDDMIATGSPRSIGAIAASLVVLIAFNATPSPRRRPRRATTGRRSSSRRDDRAVRGGDPPVDEERADARHRAHRDPAHATRDPRRHHPDQRLVGEPRAEPRPGDRRHGVRRPLDLPDLPADRSGARLDRPRRSS